MAPGPFRDETAVAIEAVRDALGHAREQAGRSAVAAKGARDVVTAADLAIEDRVRRTLIDALGAVVVGEERGGDPATGSYWILDPICGTRNFAAGIPLYCVNLALVEDGRVTASVIGDPSTGELVVTERGRGARALGERGERELRASRHSSTVVIEDSHARGARREQAAAFMAAAIRADRWELRSLSTTLALPYVAAGRAAAYVLFWTSAIHAAAGSLAAAEAGATVTDLDGAPWHLGSESIVASADRDLHEELLGLLAQASR